MVRESGAAGRIRLRSFNPTTRLGAGSLRRDDLLHVIESVVQFHTGVERRRRVLRVRSTDGCRAGLGRRRTPGLTGRLLAQIPLFVGRLDTGEPVVPGGIPRILRSLDVVRVCLQGSGRLPLRSRPWVRVPRRYVALDRRVHRRFAAVIEARLQGVLAAVGEAPASQCSS